MIIESYFCAVASSNTIFDYPGRYKSYKNHVSVKTKSPDNTADDDSVAADAEDVGTYEPDEHTHMLGCCTRKAVPDELKGEDAVPACDGKTTACSKGAEILSTVILESKTLGYYNATNVSRVVMVVPVAGVDADGARCGSVLP